MKYCLCENLSLIGEVEDHLSERKVVKKLFAEIVKDNSLPVDCYKAIFYSDYKCNCFFWANEHILCLNKTCFYPISKLTYISRNEIHVITINIINRKKFDIALITLIYLNRIIWDDDKIILAIEIILESITLEELKEIVKYSITSSKKYSEIAYKKVKKETINYKFNDKKNNRVTNLTKRRFHTSVKFKSENNEFTERLVRVRDRQFKDLQPKIKYPITIEDLKNSESEYIKINFYAEVVESGKINLENVNKVVIKKWLTAIENNSNDLFVYHFLEHSIARKRLKPCIKLITSKKAFQWYKIKLIKFLCTGNHSKDFKWILYTKKGIGVNNFATDDKLISFLQLWFSEDHVNYSLSKVGRSLGKGKNLFYKTIKSHTRKPLNYNLGTLDYETAKWYRDEGTLKPMFPYTFSFTSFEISNKEEEINIKSYVYQFDTEEEHINDISEFVEMLISIAKENNINWTIWVHNLDFDVYFIFGRLKRLRDLYLEKTGKAFFKIKFLHHKGKIIKIDLKFESIFIKVDEDKYKPFEIKFKCSYILHGGRLNDLARGYLGDVQKIEFPKNIMKNELFSEEPIRLENSSLSKEDYGNYLENFKNYKNHIEMSKDYCLKDTVILAKCIAHFLFRLKSLINDKFNIDKLTRGTRITFHTYISIYAQGDYENALIDINIEGTIGKFLKSGLVGGRTEMFNLFPLEHEEINYYDFPGIYGIIIQIPLPTGAPVYIKTCEISGHENCLKFLEDLKENNLCALIQAELYVPIQKDGDRNIPILHSKVRTRTKFSSDTKLYFPTGQITGTYWDLRLYLRSQINKTKFIKFNKVIIFEKGYPFKKYIEYLTEIKERRKLSGNESIKNIAKLKINKLYGRTAMNPRLTVLEVFRRTKEASEIEKRVKGRKNRKFDGLYTRTITYNDDETGGGLILFEDTEVDPENTNFAVARFITIIGRIMLCIANKNFLENFPDAKLAYVDTDSLFYIIKKGRNPNGIVLLREKDGIKIPEKVPELIWKDGETYSEGQFLAPKFYWVKKENGEIKVVCKGIKIIDNKEEIVEKIKYSISERKKDRLIKVEGQTVYRKFSFKNGASLFLNFLPTTKEITPFLNPKRKLIKNKINIYYTSAPFHNLHTVFEERLKTISTEKYYRDVFLRSTSDEQNKLREIIDEIVKLSEKPVYINNENVKEIKTGENYIVKANLGEGELYIKEFLLFGIDIIIIQRKKLDGTIHREFFFSKLQIIDTSNHPVIKIIEWHIIAWIGKIIIHNKLYEIEKWLKGIPGVKIQLGKIVSVSNQGGVENILINKILGELPIIESPRKGFLTRSKKIIRNYDQVYESGLVNWYHGGNKDTIETIEKYEYSIELQWKYQFCIIIVVDSQKEFTDWGIGGKKFDDSFPTIKRYLDKFIENKIYKPSKWPEELIKLRRGYEKWKEYNKSDEW